MAARNFSNQARNVANATNVAEQMQSLAGEYCTNSDQLDSSPTAVLGSGAISVYNEIVWRRHQRPLHVGADVCRTRVDAHGLPSDRAPSNSGPL